VFRVSHNGKILRESINIHTPGALSDFVASLTAQLDDVFPGMLSLSFMGKPVGSDEDLLRFADAWQQQLRDRNRAQFVSTLEALKHHARTVDAQRVLQEVLSVLLVVWKYASQPQFAVDFPPLAMRALCRLTLSRHVPVRSAAVAVLATLAAQPQTSGRLRKAHLARNLAAGMKTELAVALPSTTTPAGHDAPSGEQASVPSVPGPASPQEKVLRQATQPLTSFALELASYLEDVAVTSQAGTVFALLAVHDPSMILTSPRAFALLVRLAADATSVDSAMQAMASLCSTPSGAHKAATQLAGCGGAGALGSVATQGPPIARQCLAYVLAMFAVVAPRILADRAVFHHIEELQRWGQSSSNQYESLMVGGRAAEELFDQHVALALWSVGLQTQPLCLSDSTPGHVHAAAMNDLHDRLMPAVVLAQSPSVTVATSGLASLGVLVGDVASVGIVLDEGILGIIAHVLQSQQLGGRPMEAALSCLSAMVEAKGGPEARVQVRCSSARAWVFSWRFTIKSQRVLA